MGNQAPQEILLQAMLNRLRPALQLAPRTGRCVVQRFQALSAGAGKNYSKNFGDHSWRQQNHIWTESEIQERMLTANMKHVPQNLSSHCDITSFASFSCSSSCSSKFLTKASSSPTLSVHCCTTSSLCEIDLSDSIN